MLNINNIGISKRRNQVKVANCDSKNCNLNTNCVRYKPKNTGCLNYQETFPTQGSLCVGFKVKVETL